jgi:hypothetical protein
MMQKNDKGMQARKYYIDNYYKKEKNSTKQIQLIDFNNGTKRCIFCDRELDIEDNYCDGCDAPQCQDDID